MKEIFTTLNTAAIVQRAVKITRQQTNGHVHFSGALFSYAVTRAMVKMVYCVM